jgi:F-type H+-transporting ATPase subunit alpha
LPAYSSVAGNLKLAYAQFEELETFARFGTRLDDNTRKVIEHGKRIRECFKQPELEPIPFLEQIMVLLALTNGLLDPIPLEKIKEAEKAIRESKDKIPPDVVKRVFSDNPLSDADRDIIVNLARTILIPFIPVKKEEAPEPTEKKSQKK